MPESFLVRRVTSVLLSAVDTLAHIFATMDGGNIPRSPRARGHRRAIKSRRKHSQYQQQRRMGARRKYSVDPSTDSTTPTYSTRGTPRHCLCPANSDVNGDGSRDGDQVMTMLVCDEVGARMKMENGSELGEHNVELSKGRLPPTALTVEADSPHTLNSNRPSASSHSQPLFPPAPLPPLPPPPPLALPLPPPPLSPYVLRRSTSSSSCSSCSSPFWNTISDSPKAAQSSCFSNDPSSSTTPTRTSQHRKRRRQHSRESGTKEKERRKEEFFQKTLRSHNDDRTVVSLPSASLAMPPSALSSKSKNDNPRVNCDLSNSISSNQSQHHNTLAFKSDVVTPKRMNTTRSIVIPASPSLLQHHLRPGRRVRFDSIVHTWT